MKEKILSEGTRQKAKYCNYIFSLPLNLKKEKKRKKVLSADNIADTLNTCVRV